MNYFEFDPTLAKKLIEIMTKNCNGLGNRWLHLDVFPYRNFQNPLLNQNKSIQLSAVDNELEDFLQDHVSECEVSCGNLLWNEVEAPDTSVLVTGIGTTIPKDLGTQLKLSELPFAPTFIIDGINSISAFYRFSTPESFEDIRELHELKSQLDQFLGLAPRGFEPYFAPIAGTPRLKSMPNDSDEALELQMAEFELINAKTDYEKSLLSRKIRSLGQNSAMNF